ncbi:NYN domain-containing protein [Ilyonectria sp. MPI-CAGE-AT-0026]|nr:NYN domain-containing protein [Ilyonectria sp. MPI-CAGE-AT-0026]
MSSETTARLAVLIDADNATPKSASHLLEEIAKYGTAFVKRAYGDWTGTNLTGWKEQLLTHSIQPVQQFPYTQGKNATDSAMIIDAMDLLYTNRFNGFCIVSSDSDFTRLAARIRESGLVVYGFGEGKTPKPFVKACDKFIYIENILPERQDRAGVLTSPQLHQRTPSTKIQMDSVVKERLKKAIEASSDETGWANLAKVGGLMTKQYPEFDPRTYGFDKLGHLISKLHLFEIEQRSPGPGKPMVVYTRIPPA